MSDNYFVRAEDIAEEQIIVVRVERPYDCDPSMGAISWEDSFEYDDGRAHRAARRAAEVVAKRWAETINGNPRYGNRTASWDCNW